MDEGSVLNVSIPFRGLGFYSVLIQLLRCCLFYSPRLPHSHSRLVTGATEKGKIG